MRIKIEFEINLPDIEYNVKDLDEFLRYKYGDIFSMKGDNPFEKHEPETRRGSLMWWFRDKK